MLNLNVNLNKGIEVPGVPRGIKFYLQNLLNRPLRILLWLAIGMSLHMMAIAAWLLTSRSVHAVYHIQYKPEIALSQQQRPALARAFVERVVNSIAEPVTATFNDARNTIELSRAPVWTARAAELQSRWDARVAQSWPHFAEIEGVAKGQRWSRPEKSPLLWAYLASATMLWLMIPVSGIMRFLLRRHRPVDYKTIFTAFGQKLTIQIPRFRKNIPIALNKDREIIDDLRYLTEYLLQRFGKRGCAIGVGSSFQGEGKTTLSLLLAQGLSRIEDVLIVDADPRQNIIWLHQDPATWGSLCNEKVSVVAAREIDGRRLRSQVTDCLQQRKQRYAIVDTGPIAMCGYSPPVLKICDFFLFVLDELHDGCALDAAVRRMESFGIKPDAVVINRVHPTMANGLMFMPYHLLYKMY
jgi:hypothetical protein